MTNVFASRTSWVAPLFAVVLMASACGSDTVELPTTAEGGETTTTTALQSSTTAAKTTIAGATTTTTMPPDSSTSTAATTTTTSTTIAAGPGTLAMTRIVFEPTRYVVITNVGSGDAELGRHWVCIRPSYQQLPQLLLEPGQSVAIGLDDEPPPDLVGFAEVLSLGPVLGAFDATDGELALYNAADFGSPEAILDYAEWGSSGHGRSSVAVEAGIWETGAFIDIPEEAFSISSSGAPDGGAADWFVDLGG